ncbi:hypothetical protein ACA910_009141 [Epithemia clementina (nom. ined.)]
MDATAGFISLGGGDRVQKSPPSFLFPVLKFSEIVQCLEELEINLTKQELSDPSHHRDRLRLMWFQVLEVCTGQTEVDLQIPIKFPENVGEDFKANHNGFGDVPLFRAVRRLMEIAGYDHFSMRDLYAPETKRIKHQLSAIINMAKHREEQLRFYTELIEPRAELIAALEEVNDENKLLHGQLAEAQKSSEIKSSELQAIMDECSEMELEIARDNRTQATLRNEAAELKRQANDMEDELTAAKWTLEELEQQQENLRAQLVTSPDRLMRVAEELRLRVQLEKKENSTLEDKIQQCKVALRNLQKLDKDLHATTAMLGELHQSATKCMNIVNSIEDIEAKISDQEKQLGKIEEETKQTQRRIHRSEEEIIAQRKQHSLELEAAQEALDSFKSQLLAVEKDRREGMLRVQQGEAEVQAIKEAMERDRSETEREIAELFAEFNKAKERFTERDRERRRVLNIISVNDNKSNS